MSNITLLNEYILKLVYDHLKLRDKFAFSLTIKKFHIIFSDYPLLDTFYEINQGEGRYENQFLFKNIVNIRVVHALVDNNYIENFLNLRHLDLSQVEFSGFNQVKTLINHLPQKVLDITVMDDDKRLHEEAIISDTSPKRIRTPSPVIRKLDKHWEEYILYRSRLKFAAVSPSNFLPTDLFNKFPTLKDVHYEASIDVRALANFDLNDNQTNVIEQATSRLREILIHSVVTTQDNNWIFISQAEIYYHDKKVDDVAQVDKNDSYSEELTPNIVKRQEGKSTWFELCFWCNRFEVVATGGYYNNKSKDDKLCTFLGKPSLASGHSETTKEMQASKSGVSSPACLIP
ncbi:hypothetical protein HPULCUR_002291 [Helicostylum pulchrum]|uniref:F-box domain-containing protein n=1 Tax=Helicostylum pulchrum TaxID=562976 RepID=A0ABP9XRV9_9FUNG